MKGFVKDIENIAVKKEDEVVLIGTQKDLTVSVASFSDLSNQLNYELLTRIAKTIRQADEADRIHIF